VSLERLILIEGVLPLTSTLLLGEVPKDLSIPMLLVGNTVGKETCCKLNMIVELKVEVKLNLFAIFPIGTTIQDGGKRKRSDVDQILTKLKVYFEIFYINNIEYVNRPW